MIDRYESGVEYIGTGDYVGTMDKSSDGDWVYYSDHEAELATLRARVEELETALADECGERAAAEARLAQLEAPPVVTQAERELLEQVRQFEPGQLLDLVCAALDVIAPEFRNSTPEQAIAAWRAWAAAADRVPEALDRDATDPAGEGERHGLR